MSLEILAEAAVTTARTRKRGRLNDAPGMMTMVVPIDMSNQGIQRMLQINKVRFGLDEQHSVLYVFFEKNDKKRRSAKTGRFQAHEEEYPYLGSSTEELAQHIATQNICDIGTLAAMYPAAFWNAVYLLGKDLDTISQELF